MSKEIREQIDMIKNFGKPLNENNGVNLHVYSNSVEKIKKNNIKLDSKKVVNGVEFELDKTPNYAPNNPNDVQYYSYIYVNKGKYPTKTYKGFKYTNTFLINLDGSIMQEVFKIENSIKEFKTEDEVLNAIDRLYIVIDNNYKNATNKIDLTTIGKNYKDRKGESMLNRFKGKENGFIDLIDSLLINAVTSINEYKTLMLETVYFLIQNEHNITNMEKEMCMAALAKKYIEIYS